MSDHEAPEHGAGPDPIDKAYAEAEALLNDDDGRAARRARVLAAIARETMRPAAPLRTSRLAWARLAWRREAWLAAAGVAGFSVFLATRLHVPVQTLPSAAPPAPAASDQATSIAATASPAAPTTPRVSGHAASPATKAFPAAPRSPASAAARAIPEVAPTAPPSPLAVVAPAPRTFAPAPSAPRPEVVVTGQRRQGASQADLQGGLSADAHDEAVEANSAARSAATRAPSSAYAAPPAAVAQSRFETSGDLASEPAARLRAAAAAGRAAEVTSLLAQGVPVDSADAKGETALMKSIQADQPAVAALLRRHGASLDLRNHVGESARELATAKGDAKLNQALGVDP
jgi:hypothetical protein